MVPQDDVVHRRLTVEQALGYAAELRLPPETTKDNRRQVMAQVLEELEMTPTPRPGWRTCPADSENAHRWRWSC